MIKTIFELGKGNIDFLAFALIAVLVVGSLTTGLDFLPAAGIAVVLGALWVIMRYALLWLQSRERLRKLKGNATIRGHKELEKHATEDELEDLFKDHERSGDDNGY